MAAQVIGKLVGLSGRFGGWHECIRWRSSLDVIPQLDLYQPYELVPEVPRVQEKVAHFFPGETAYQDHSKCIDKVPVSNEMIYGQWFA